MNCPACSKPLKEISVRNITVDVCSDGCGGVWFDREELEGFDHHSEEAPLELLRPVKNQNVAVDREADRKCPRCVDTLMWRKNYRSQYHLVVDFCPKCGGLFLDMGELEALRELNTNSGERQRVIDWVNSLRSEGNDEVPERLRAVVELIF